MPLSLEDVEFPPPRPMPRRPQVSPPASLEAAAPSVPCQGGSMRYKDAGLCVTRRGCYAASVARGSSAFRVGGVDMRYTDGGLCIICEICKGVCIICRGCMHSVVRICVYTRRPSREALTYIIWRGLCILSCLGASALHSKMSAEHRGLAGIFKAKKAGWHTLH